jgi:dolichol-phosphate mannosyltransferase
MRTLVFTATYNEAPNAADLVAAVFSALPDCEMLVVDDNSPDGTGELLDSLQSRFQRLHVVHRPAKAGVGSAHKLAITYALEHGFDGLITMDADFSHHPRYLPALAALLEQHEFVIGSRYVEGGSCEYGPARLLLSRVANTLARSLLALPLREVTTSYRGFRRPLLERMDVGRIASEGYSYFVESTFQVSRLTKRMAELPIRFEDRRRGSSKISKAEIWRGMTTLLRLAAARVFGKLVKRRRKLNCARG